jgi:hypothetical protein
MALHKPVNVRATNGIWDRGEDDSCPRDHLLDARNVHYEGDDIVTRDGSTREHTLANIVRHFEYRRIGEASRYLILDSSGDLYDSTNLSSPILEIPAMVDFSFLNFFNRAYITPHTRAQGVSGNSVYVYNGSGTARAAAGAAPSGSLASAQSATAGNIPAGTRLFAVAYETDSGFITAPGPAIFSEYVGATSNFKVDLSTIPTGPTGTSKRHILSTRSISSYDGNQNGYAWYFVPGGVIENNTATTLTVNFYDTDLTSTADYLIDQLSTIGAGLGMCELDGRLVLWGVDGNESTVYVSKSGHPESINSIAGFLVVDPTEAGIIENCWEFRGALMIQKRRRMYQAGVTVADAGYWKWISVDRGKGTTCFGVANIIDSRGSNLDYAIIMDQSGVWRYDGVVREPDLTWKIRSLWKNRVNQTVLETIQVSIDPVHKLIFVSVPLDGATSPSHVLVGDFQNGMNHEAIRWTIYNFPVACTSILVQEDPTLEYPVLNYASSAGNVYSIDSATTNDASTAIPDPQIKTSLLSRWRDGTIEHFGRAVIRVQGSGNLDLQTSGLDGQHTTTPQVVVLATTPGYSKHLWINAESERIAVKLSTNAINEKFTFSGMTIYSAFKWSSRPISS